MKVIVCGDRNWTDYSKVYDRIKQLPPDTIIISGCARGADTMGEWAADDLDLKIIRVPAKWSEYGKAAGPLRNDQMIALKPGLVLAFHSDLSKSKGTADTVAKARAKGIPTEVIK